ncbi:MAG: GMC oxidoreductase [Geminicoccaceae bacterium]
MLRGDGAQLLWRRSNMTAHRKLVARTKETFRAAGFPTCFRACSMAVCPRTSAALVRWGATRRYPSSIRQCRLRDHPNLFVTDGSAANSAAVNPALTVAAIALRAAGTIRQELTT